MADALREMRERLAALTAERDRAERELRALTEELQAANKELEAFSYAVSHDLRSPLWVIDGFSYLLLTQHASQLSPEAQHCLQLIQKHVQQMGRMIKDLLALSRLSRQPLNKQPVASAELARQVLSELWVEPGGRCVEISIGDLPPCQADPALLKQVFVNLLSNALKFTAQRDVAVVEVGCRRAGDEPVYFIRDNGAGFDMRYADKLFRVFQRLHRDQEYEGAGVGLALVQRIIHRHGGRIWAESEVGQGATFFFTLGREPA